MVQLDNRMYQLFHKMLQSFRIYGLIKHKKLVNREGGTTLQITLFFIENSKNQSGPKVLNFVRSNRPKKFSFFIKRVLFFQCNADHKVFY